MSLRRRLAAGTAIALAAFGSLTLVALEGGRVAVIETVQPDGGARRTHVWFAEHDGAFWIESATAERPFYRDLERAPVARLLWRESCFEPMADAGRLRAELVEEPGGHDRVRALLARDYGWADQWIGLLQDTSSSRAVRLLR